MKGRFHPAFEVELIEAARYLEQKRPDFGRQFIDEVEAGIERIIEAPELWRPWRGYPTFFTAAISLHDSLPDSARRRCGGISERASHRPTSRYRIGSIESTGSKPRSRRGSGGKPMSNPALSHKERRRRIGPRTREARLSKSGLLPVIPCRDSPHDPFRAAPFRAAPERPVES